MQGVQLEIKPDFEQRLEQVQLWDGLPLPPGLKARGGREHARIELNFWLDWYIICRRHASTGWSGGTPALVMTKTTSDPDSISSTSKTIFCNVYYFYVVLPLWFFTFEWAPSIIRSPRIAKPLLDLFGNRVLSISLEQIDRNM
jgi:hypothetical protein